MNRSHQVHLKQDAQGPRQTIHCAQDGCQPATQIVLKTVQGNAMNYGGRK